MLISRLKICDTFVPRFAQNERLVSNDMILVFSLKEDKHLHTIKVIEWHMLRKSKYINKILNKVLSVLPCNNLISSFL